jgi:glycopeptide antibiotics resistance protein
LALVVAALYLISLAALLVSPVTSVRYQDQLWDWTARYLGFGWSAGREAALDALINVALFVPVGFLLHRRLRAECRWSRYAARWTVTVAAALAAAIEFIQIFLPARHASIFDVLAAVAGAAIGMALDVAVRRKQTPSRISASEPDP